MQRHPPTCILVYRARAVENFVHLVHCGEAFSRLLWCGSLACRANVMTATFLSPRSPYALVRHWENASGQERAPKRNPPKRVKEYQRGENDSNVTDKSSPGSGVFSPFASRKDPNERWACRGSNNPIGGYAGRTAHSRNAPFETSCFNWCVGSLNNSPSYLPASRATYALRLLPAHGDSGATRLGSSSATTESWRMRRQMPATGPKRQ